MALVSLHHQEQPQIKTVTPYLAPVILSLLAGVVLHRRPCQRPRVATDVLPRRLRAMQELPAYKPRIMNSTDLGADPDDGQSMVHQLVCARISRRCMDLRFGC